jgi:hypothetical protein
MFRHAALHAESIFLFLTKPTCPNEEGNVLSLPIQKDFPALVEKYVDFIIKMLPLVLNKLFCPFTLPLTTVLP